MSDAHAFFLEDGDRFVPTPLTRGPWSPDHQHGGPPAALLARAIEGVPAERPMQVARVTVEFLRPVPLVPLTQSTRVLKPGRTAQLVEAALFAGDREVARATGLRVRREQVQLPPRAATTAPPPGPEGVAPFVFPFFQDPVGYHTGVELRIARGEFGRGPVAAWIRMRYALVAEEEPSPLQRVIIAADSGNGVSLVLDVRRYTFVNPDLTVYLHRMPEGAWVCLDAVTTPQPTGVGLAESGLFDARGAIGRSLQTLVVAARQPG